MRAAGRIRSAAARANWAVGVASVVWPAFVIIPIYLIVKDSLQTTDSYLDGGPLSLPHHLTFGNVADVFHRGFTRYLINTAIVTAASAGLTVLLAFPAAHAIVRSRSRLVSGMFRIFLAGLAIPAQATIIRSDLWYNTLGSGYIATALRAAHVADPNAKLYINDYNIEGAGAKSDAMYNLVRSLKAQGVPLDGVGFQSHLAVQYGFPSGMQANLQRFADLGLDVAITELDVRMVLPADPSKVATQATYNFSYSGTNAAPTVFTLNGTACS